MTKQFAAIVVAVALFFGRGGEPAPLLTGAPPGMADSCFASATATGRLVVDPTYGTAIIDDGRHSMVGLRDEPMTVAWRSGFKARWIGSQVEVLDPWGNVVAITGRSYTIDGGLTSAPTWPGSEETVFWACDEVQPLP